jgi:glycosyltransferase involved in cell wall biosynthesis
MACGTPVAAYPVTGPLDVVEHGVTGWLAEDLGEAAARALQIDRTACRRAAEGKSWHAAAMQFLANLVPSRAVPHSLPPRVPRIRKTGLQHAGPAR